MKKFLLILTLFGTLLIGVSYADSAQESSLFNAILTGNITEVDKLIKDGVSVNAKSVTGFTPLLFACSLNKTDIAVLLLNSGADPNLAGNQNETPLLYAVMTSNQILVKELLNRGADPNTKMATGQSPLDMAKVLHQNEIAAMMATNQNNKVISQNNNTSLGEAETTNIKTIFHILNDDSVDNIKNDSSIDKNLGFSYDIGNSGQDMFFLTTPYSALRYILYQEKHTFIDPDKSQVDELFKLRNYIFINTRKYVKFSGLVSTIPKNLVIRKDGTVYKSLPIKPLTLISWGIPEAGIWAFPIGLFDGEDMEIIAIDSYNYQVVLKLKGKKLTALK